MTLIRKWLLRRAIDRLRREYPLLAGMTYGQLRRLRITDISADHDSLVFCLEPMPEPDGAASLPLEGK